MVNPRDRSPSCIVRWDMANDEKQAAKKPTDEQPCSNAFPAMHSDDGRGSSRKAMDRTAKGLGWGRNISTHILSCLAK